jgi:hypothetical protein
LYSFEDTQIVIQTTENTIVGDPIEFLIGDCNSKNSIVYENVTLPNDWKPSKYLFDGSTWSKNPDYIEPPVASPAE